MINDQLYEKYVIRQDGKDIITRFSLRASIARISNGLFTCLFENLEPDRSGAKAKHPGPAAAC